MKGRRVPPLSPEQLRRAAVIAAAPTDAQWETAVQARTLEPRQMALGVIQHAETNHYHAWASLYGTDVSSIGVYASPESAIDLVHRIGAVFRAWEGRPEDTRALNALIAEGVRDSVVPNAQMVLPDDQVRAIMAAIADRQQRRS